uniref:Variant surface glycoprotein 1125.4843 n=1 Tax=Trypanosoma brucei TaxID=5691 RepID=A0A1J0RB24_9TRYP|nr:variant surface glycoprotein 1125.4843 [Trypanosoma brucei]
MTAEKTAQKSAEILTATLLLAATGKSSNDVSEIGHDVTKWCHELEYLNEISNQLNQEVDRRTDTIAENVETQSIWRISEAEAASSTDAVKYNGLLLYAQHHQATKLAKLKLLQQEISRLQPHINRRIQVIRSAELLTRLFKREISGTAQHTATETACTLKLTIATEKSYTYELSSAETKAATGTLRKKLATATKLKLGDLSKMEYLLTEPQFLMSATGTPQLFDTTQTGNSQCTTKVTNGTLIKGETHHVTVAYTEAMLKAIRARTETIETGNTELPTSDNEKITTNWLRTEYITEGLAAIKPLHASKPLDLKTLRVTDLKSNLDRRLVTNLQGKDGAGDEMSDSKDTEAADKLINSLYEADDSNFADNFIKSLKNKPVKYKKDGEEQTTDIGKLATNPDLELALSYIEGMKTVRKLEEAAESKDVAKKTETEEQTEVKRRREGNRN